MQAAINAGVKHFIHISSLSVITGDQDQFKVNEEQVPIYSRELYANSKIEAEKVALAHAADGHINVTILRPGFIYGPGERTWMPKLIQAMKKGRALLVGNTDKETKNSRKTIQRKRRYGTKRNSFAHALILDVS